MFWDDTPAPKVIKEKIKRVPPARVWESPDYLPYLDEARAFPVQVMSREDLMAAAAAGDRFIFDIEVYPNYFLCSFLSLATRKVAIFEKFDGRQLDLPLLQWILKNICIIGFNSNDFDLPILALAMAGASFEAMQAAAHAIIKLGESGRDVLKAARVKRLKANHIDLIEVCPLQASLKAYAGRLHAQRMQDLPIAPGTFLTEDQRCVVRWYNVASDLPATALVYQELSEQIKLRERLSVEYGVDLRSRSDAQIAEAVIGHEVARLNGASAKRPEISPGTFYYQPPAFLRYRSALLNDVFSRVCSAQFEIDKGGLVGLPEEIRALKFTIAGSTYQMGNGGLHTCEQNVYYCSSAQRIIFDRDVISYYPRLILNSGMFPDQLGSNFLRVYSSIVERRVRAKEAKDVVTAESLKITANGTFGKLGSPYSLLYAPKLLLQVTLTGQLALLMLVERLELAGISVVSANTDGVVISCPVELQSAYLAIVQEWEADTGLKTEEAIYRAIYSRDVNNYIAIKADGKAKAKGAYSNPWATKELAIFRFHKNPVNLICSEAVEKFLATGRPIAETIQACRDITRFITVRSVRGGAAKDGEYLGRCVRWYYAKDETGEIQYITNGNLVPRSAGARPLPNLPATLPDDLDFDWYIAEARGMLEALGIPPAAI